MGTRGPIPHSAAKHAANGNVSAISKRKAREVEIDGIVADPPPYLNQHGKWLWVAILDDIGPRCRSSDLATIATYCSQYQIFVAACETMKVADIIYEDEKGVRRANPAIAIIDKFMNTAKSLNAQLGITPVCRQRLEAAIHVPEQDDIDKELLG